MSADFPPPPNDESEDDEEMSDCDGEEDTEEENRESNQEGSSLALFNAIAAAGCPPQSYSNLSQLDMLPQEFLLSCFQEATSQAPWEKIDRGQPESESEQRFVVRDRVWSKFSEDGRWYQALVISVNETRHSAVVRYHEYGNEEEVPIKMLRPA